MGNDNLRLIAVPARHIDYAWKDGAYKLGESCIDDCTPEQLKYAIAREDRQLVRMDEEGKTVGWGAYQIINYPNIRCFFITNLWARGAHFERFYDQLKTLAEQLGCSRIRCAAQPAQSRIFQRKLGFTPVYETLEVSLC